MRFISLVCSFGLSASGTRPTMLITCPISEVSSRAESYRRWMYLQKRCRAMSAAHKELSGLLLFQIGSDTSSLASIEWLDWISAANHARLLDHTIEPRSIV